MKKPQKKQVIIHFPLGTQGLGYGVDCHLMCGEVVNRMGRLAVELAFFGGAQLVWFTSREVVSA